jgi:DNA-binding transcriptional regulator YdaS (Cro superfamily)
MTGIERAIQALGGQAALAAACGVTQPAVSRWVRQGYVPRRRWTLVAYATGVGVEDLALDMARGGK